MSDAALVALARERSTARASPAIETARRCVALVYERHRNLVRAAIASKVPLEAVDDLEGDVYLRFVRTVYLRRRPIEVPAGLLVIMAAPGRRHLPRPAQADARLARRARRPRGRRGRV